MSDAAEVRALIAEARQFAGAAYLQDSMVYNVITRLADALEAAHAEPDDEREALAGTNAHDVVGRFAFDGAEGIAFHIYSDCSQEHSQARIMFDDLEDLKAFLTHNLPGLFGGERAAPSGDDDEREALAVAVGRVLFDVSNFPEKAQSRLLGQSMAPLWQKLVESVEAAGFRRSARMPVSRDELAKFIAEWEATDAAGFGSCNAPRDMAADIADRFDIYNKDSA